jgi:uncharacterized protein (DUF58 family)
MPNDNTAPGVPEGRVREDGPGGLGDLLRAIAERTRLTPAGAIFMASSAGVGAIAYQTGNNLVFAVFSLLLGVLLFSRILPWATTRRIRIVRAMPEDIFAGMPVNFAVLLINHGRWLSAFGITVRDLIDVPAFRLGPPAFFTAVGPRASAEAPFEVRFRRRGRYRTETWEIECGFPFGLFTRRVRGRDPAEFIVLPKPRPLKQRIVLRETGTPLCGMELSPRRGEEEEFRALRPYQAGDPLKKIHWKTSARAGELLVRVMENQEQHRVTVLLDSFPDPKKRRFRRAVSLERGVRVAASVAADLEKRGFEYRIGYANDEFTLTPFGRGPQHLRAILERLALLEPSPDVGPAQLVREAVSRTGSQHHLIVLLLSPDRARDLREALSRPALRYVSAYDVSRPSLPQVI